MQNNLCEIVEQQNSIISIQSGIINELFQLLGQHIAVEELDRLPVAARINEAARLRAGIGSGE